ncbi:hypothetical protein [Enterovibrio norvegicus]|uniref:hypothetical protein n=1 Tax=Enterovibrio norvegicus TaxID=188144 RepID=UPI00354F5E30
MLHNNIESVLLHHTKAMIANSSLSQSAFICELLFPALTKHGIEKPDEYRTADEYDAWVAAKRRQLSSIMNGHTNVPAKWVNVWMECLPVPYGPAARADLLAVMGVMDISLQPLSGGITKRSSLPALLRETAQVLDASADVMADGQYDENDDPDALNNTADELLDVIELCLCEVMKINQVTPLKGRAAVIKQLFK